MKGKLNIYRDNFLEKEELNRLMSFIEDNPALFLFTSNTQSFGVIQQGATLGSDPAFKIEVGSNSNTIKLVTDSYALDVNGSLIYQRAFDNLPIATDDAWYWVKISHRFDNYEQGYVSVATDGTLSGTNTSFLSTLRGASSGFPTKVKFFVEAADGTLTYPYNSGIYEVTAVAGDNTATLAGDFVAESGLRFVVLGAFSIKTSTSAITSDGLYSYDSCNIDFVAETVSDTAPITGFVADENFYVARVKSDGVTVTVEDKRSNYYFRLNFGDIIVSNKADTDAGNLTGGDVAAWRYILQVYSTSEITAALANYLTKADNLNSVANKTTARSNLGVYSTTAIDNTIGNRTYSLNNIITDSESITASLEKLDLAVVLHTKVVQLGDWNMDADAAYTGVDLQWAALGLTYSKIVSVECFIKTDDASVVYPLGLTTSAGVTSVAGSLSWGTTGIALQRHTGGLFDGTDFNATSYSRGWVVIRYTL